VVFQNRIKQLIFLLLFFSFFSISMAVTFPSFDYTTTNYPSGQLDILGKSSSGTSVELFVNSNYVSKQNIISSLVQVNLTNGIKSAAIPIGATLRFFNLDQLNTYTLNISGFGIKTLNYGEFYDYTSNVEGQVSYRNEKTGVSKTITVIDKLEQFNFSNINQRYLLDGQNKINFKISSLSNNKLLSYKNFSVNYDKYPITISINNFNNVSNKKEINISGVTSDFQSPLKYVVNQLGEIGNLGMLNSITTDTSGNFNITATNFKEGNNSIRFISLDKNNLNLFNGEKIINVLIDTLPPTMNIVSSKYDATVNSKRVSRSADFTSSQLYVNGQNIVLNISTDAIKIDMTLNSQNKTCSNKVGDFIICNLNLVLGQNNLTLIATDIAGNIAKKAHQINFDNKPINLDQKSLKPKSGDTVHFFLQDFSGKVNKPGAKIMVFTIPQDSKYFYSDSSGVQRQKTATCRDYKFLGNRNVGTADNGFTQSPQINLADEQISLTDLIQKKVESTADGNGNFKIKNLILKDKNLNSNGINQNSNEVGSVKSPNTVCYVLSDQYGNVNTYSSTITLDGGNTLWISQQITAIPSTIYAAEIEQLGNSRTGQGNVRVGVIAKIHYVGGGKVKEITAPIISIDRGFGSSASKYAKVISNEMNYKLDTATGDMILYFPVEISKMNIKPLDYPKSLKIGFKLSVVYSLFDLDIPIDTKNPIYFQTSLNIERPLDNTKWLSPQMIQNSLAFLNKSIDYTKKAAKYTGIAAVAGVIACTGAKFYYGIKIASADNEPDKNGYREKLYNICDRVICSAAPDRCDGSNIDKINNKPDSSVLKLKQGQNNYNKLDLSSNSVLKNDKSGKKLATFDNLALNEANLCDFNGDGKKDDGILMNGEITTYGDVAGSWYQTGIKGKERLNQRCAKYKKKGFYNSTGGWSKTKTGDFNQELTSSQVDLKSVGTACYSDKAPKFDNTRTLGSPGTNPKDNIIESVRSACITDTYSHLKKYLKIQEGIQKCLEEAKIGVATGSYCERLMSQAVCDVATNVLFKTVAQKSFRGDGKGNDPHSGIGNLFAGAKEGDKLLSDRYSGSSFYNAAGLSSEQISNKVCLAAFTGDWTVLTDSILGAVDANQVDPTFGPMFPESRMQGYNPLTGDLSIRYKFTYAGVSGGQYITTKVDLICDKSKPGSDFCPEGINIAKNYQGPKTLSISKDSTAQDTIIISDTHARYKYNVIKLTHTYQLDGKTLTKTFEEPISHKRAGLLANCHWGAGVMGSGAANSNGGIVCDTLFSSDALVSAYSFSSGSKLMPEGVRVLYPTNDVFVKINYDVRDPKNTQNGFDIGYRAICQAIDGKTTKVSYTPITPKGNVGSQVESLFTIPELGNTLKGETTTFNLQLDGVMATNLTDSKNLKLEFTNNEGTVGQNFEVISLLDDSSTSNSVQINQNLIVNNGGVVSSASYVLKKKFTFSDAQHLSLKLKGDIKGIAVKLGEYRFTPASVSTVLSGDKFSGLQEGSCDLTLKILPSGKGSELTYDNFDKISAIGSSSDIKTNVGTKNSVVKLNFVVKKTPTSPKPSKDWFGIISPTNNNFKEVCSNGGSIPIEYLFQTPNTKPYENLKVDLALVANKYDLKIDPISISSLTLGKNVTNDFKLTNPSKDLIGKNLEMTLSYTLKDTSKDLNQQTIDTKNIKFNMKINDCVGNDAKTLI